MAIVIDESKPGILFIAYPPTHTLEEWAKHTEEMVDALLRGKVFGMVTDTTGSAPPDAAERRMIADSFEKHEGLWRKWCAGGAVIVESAMVRGAITALQWLKPPPFAHTTVGTRQDAYAWMDKRLKEFKPS